MPVSSLQNAQFTPDGATLVAWKSDATLELWDTGTHKLRKTLQGLTLYYYPSRIQFSTDSRLLITEGVEQLDTAPVLRKAQSVMRWLMSLSKAKRSRMEVVVWDMAPFMIGPLLLGAPVSITLFTTFLAITQTVSAHSGYSFGAASDGNCRDLHHERMKCNYGGDFIMDRMLGTYIAREEGRVYPRWDLAEKSLAGSFNVACSSVRTGAG